MPRKVQFYSQMADNAVVEQYTVRAVANPPQNLSVTGGFETGQAAAASFLRSKNG